MQALMFDRVLDDDMRSEDLLTLPYVLLPFRPGDFTPDRELLQWFVSDSRRVAWANDRAEEVSQYDESVLCSSCLARDCRPRIVVDPRLVVSLEGEIGRAVVFTAWRCSKDLPPGSEVDCFTFLASEAYLKP